MDRYLHWINGTRVAPLSGHYLPTSDPMTTQPWAEIARGDAADMEAAVQSAQTAFTWWRNVGPTTRADVIWRLGDLIAANADELAALEARDAGKVVREVKGQMTSLRAWYHYYASLAYQTEGRTIPQHRASLTVYTQRIPFGVVGVIPAFNSPMLLGGMGLAPALAAAGAPAVGSGVAAVEAWRTRQGGWPAGWLPEHRHGLRPGGR